MASALAKLARHDTLLFEWGEMYRASNPRVRTFRDSLGMSLQDFHANKQVQISQISKLLKRGAYTFTPLTPVFVPKTNGAERLICIPLIRDRLVQRAIYRFLSNGRYSFDNPISYGFIRGKSTRSALLNAIAKRQNSPWVYKADISSFFDKIPRDILKNELRKKVRVRSLHGIIEDAIDTEVNQSNADERKKIRKLGVKYGIGLRQGMPLSPYLANLLLWEFDNKLLASGFDVIRYADDIIAFAKSEEECREVHDKCSELLSLVRLEVYAIGEGSKTEIFSPEETAEFLGQGISRRADDKKYCLTVTKTQADRIKGKLLSYKDFEHLNRLGITLPRFLTRIDSVVQSYVATYSNCENIQKVSQMMMDTRNSVVSHVLQKAGINIDTLNSKQRKFLEL